MQVKDGKLMTITNFSILCLQSQLTVASDKARGILGKAELDLSLYGDNEFKIHKLPLTNCKYADAFVEVGLKGV